MRSSSSIKCLSPEIGISGVFWIIFRPAQLVALNELKSVMVNFLSNSEVRAARVWRWLSTIIVSVGIHSLGEIASSMM